MREKFFFRQGDSYSCGICVLNILLAKYSKPGIIFSVDRKKGTSSVKLIRELRKAGLKAKSKRISIRNLKPWSVLWYPARGKKGRRGDHYVVFIKAVNGKFFIYDSVEKEPYWLEAGTLLKKWYGIKKNGWVIEVSKPNGPA